VNQREISLSPLITTSIVFRKFHGLV